jgi:acetolactate synthase small subunit
MGKGDEKEKVFAPAERTKTGTLESLSQPQMRGEETGGVGNIEKVRDILFGTQMRDYDKRFARMEERMNREVANLRDETKKRFDALESYAKREIESLIDRLTVEQNERTELVKREAELLSNRLKGEQNERIEAVKELSKELKESDRLLEKRITQLDDQLGKTSRELRQLLLDQSKELSEEIRMKYDDAMAALEKAAQELRFDKVDRSKLSELLMSIALHLTDDAALRLNLEASD